MEPALPGNDVKGYPAWNCCWNSAFTDCMDKQGKRWSGGWHHVDSERTFYGILGKCGAAYDRAWDDKHDSSVPACNKTKGEELQIAVFAILTCGISVSADMNKVKGSLTVEAAIVIPLLLFLIVAAIDGGVELYLACRNTVIALEEEEKTDTVRLFYLCNGIGDMIGDGDSLY